MLPCSDNSRNMRKEIHTILFSDIFDRALKILSLRDHSVFELRQKLRDRFEDKEVIDQVLEKLLDLKYLDDTRFARIYSKSLQKKGKSSYMVKQSLRKKGIADTAAAPFVNQAGDLDIALATAEKKLKVLARFDSEQQRQKLGNFLRNRGFGFDIIQKVLRNLLSS